MSGELGALLGMGALGGGYLMFDAVKRLKQYRAIKDTPTKTIQSASLGDGEIKGTAKVPEDADLVETPLTGQECLFTKYELENDSGDGWKTLSQGLHGTPFVVEDETGTLFVNPSYTEPTTPVSDNDEVTLADLLAINAVKSELSASNGKLGSLTSGIEVDIESSEGEDERHDEMKFTYEEFEEESQLGRFVNEAGLNEQITSDTMLTDSEYRITEKEYLYPGEDVYLFGNLEASDMTDTEIDDDYDMTLRNANGQSGMFFISNQDEQELLAERRRYPFIAFPAGAILFAACVVFLLIYMGIL